MAEGSSSAGSRVLEVVRGTFLENVHLKFIAVLLTFALYLWVGADQVTRVVVVPFELSVPADQVLLEPKLEKVKVKLKGRSSALDRFQQQSDRSVTVELTKANDGQLLAIPHRAVETPSGLRVVTIEPSFIRVEMADKQQKTVPIQPRLAGEDRPSYEVGEVTVEPPEVGAQGPKDEMEDLEAIPTEPIDVSEREETFETEARLRPESPLIRYELDSPVRVRVEIRRKEIERTFSSVAVRAVETSYATRVSPETVEVTVRGPRAAVEGLDGGRLYAAVDLSDEDGEPPGTYEKPIRMRGLPEAVEVVDRRPRRVVVTTRPRPGAPRGEPDAGSTGTRPDAR